MVVKCPVHDVEMKLKEVPIKSGLQGYIRRIIIIVECTVKGCKKWCEVQPGYILWP